MPLVLFLHKQGSVQIVFCLFSRLIFYQKLAIIMQLLYYMFSFILCYNFASTRYSIVNIHLLRMKFCQLKTLSRKMLNAYKILLCNIFAIGNTHIICFDSNIRHLLIEYSMHLVWQCFDERINNRNFDWSDLTIPDSSFSILRMHLCRYICTKTIVIKQTFKKNNS